MVRDGAKSACEASAEPNQLLSTFTSSVCNVPQKGSHISVCLHIAKCALTRVMARARTSKRIFGGTFFLLDLGPASRINIFMRLRLGLCLQRHPVLSNFLRFSTTLSYPPQDEISGPKISSPARDREGDREARVGKSGPIKSRDSGNGQTMAPLSVGFVLSVAYGHFEAPSPRSNTPRSAVLCAPFDLFLPMEIFARSSFYVAMSHFRLQRS
jgi:hypothetical protein